MSNQHQSTLINHIMAGYQGISSRQSSSNKMYYGYLWITIVPGRSKDFAHGRLYFDVCFESPKTQVSVHCVGGSACTWRDLWWGNSANPNMHGQWTSIWAYNSLVEHICEGDRTQFSPTTTSACFEQKNIILQDISNHKACTELYYCNCIIYTVYTVYTHTYYLHTYLHICQHLDKSPVNCCMSCSSQHEASMLSIQLTCWDFHVQSFSSS